MDLARVKYCVEHIDKHPESLTHCNGVDMAYFIPDDVRNLIAEVEWLRGKVADAMRRAEKAESSLTLSREEGMMRPSKRGKKVLVEVCHIKDCEPFIYGVNGHATISALDEMEKQLHEDAGDMEEGDYLFECYYESAQVGFEGRTEIAAYWQMDQIGFWPLPDAAAIRSEAKGERG